MRSEFNLVLWPRRPADTPEQRRRFCAFHGHWFNHRGLCRCGAVLGEKRR